LRELCTAISINKGVKLSLLDLSDNKLKDRGALELSAALRENRSITYLDIRENEIMMPGGAMLVEAMM
jgi:Leucine Rich repeat